ncbi:hypothetical protein KQI76_06895 [Amphibacillus sp. MSJ-3]|uniref:hypothetical protein n=1 Tax=Amphibacillus sp. MSJ-3 TaxID=2841505 RepID=UPI001C0EC26C|nr:hypothetical protein [Amphibacillus sp. MSJ-3]MBU5594888.1 hypothetical protein [Amphibacillus sp. MSJ-3]
MEHPAVYRTRQTGYPGKEPNIYGTDARGNEVYVGDEIYIYDEEFWLADELSQDAIEVLEHFGAKRIKACYGL